MRLALTIEGDKLVVRLWQDGQTAADCDQSVLISEAEIDCKKIVRAGALPKRDYEV